VTVVPGPWQHAAMASLTIQIPCPKCGVTSPSSKGSETDWRCPNCARGYFLRRCSSCRAVSYVDAKLERHQTWACAWCQSPNSGYLMRADPAAGTQAQLAHEIARDGLVFAAPAEAGFERDPQPVLIVTTNEVPGYRIVGVHGTVFGLVVRARNIFSDFGAQLSSVVGGEVSGYTKLLIDSRNQASERMWREARSRGANAVVAMRFDCNEIGDIMSEVAAYGTAVTVEPLSPPEPDGIQL
jgi:uncharacterized protein YbjQ (UPF0145 family)